MEIRIPVEKAMLAGNLNIPDKAKGIVIFSHGSGSSRHSSRNQFVARQLEDEGMATLLFDLLTEEEDRIYANRFDIPLLTRRLSVVTEWVQQDSKTAQLPIGYFGASTGAASALWAAAEPGATVKAVVSRGGRPDLALPVLPEVKAATLLIVGDRDYGVIELNEQAFDALTGTKELVLIKGATHLFEEPGTLEEAARAARDWFMQYLSKEKYAHV